MQARVRGAVRGALAPVSLPALDKALALDAGAGPTLGSLLEELAAAGEVAGQLRGGGSTWVPAVHAQRQQDDLLSFFRSASDLLHTLTIRTSSPEQTDSLMSRSLPVTQGI